MRDPRAQPTWVGMDLWSSAICFNTVEAGKRKLPVPASWADLVRPEFKGTITMPHPASSGTGYLMVAAWLQIMGEEKGWAYMDGLHQNMGVYTHSGSKPCRQAGAGEFPVGLSFEYRASKTKKDGAPIDIVFPQEGLGWDVEATAILKTSKKQEAAKALADWAVTPEANKLYAANFAVLALPEAQEKLEFIPADLEKRLAKNDFNWAADNRDRILAEWSRRYEARSEEHTSELQSQSNLVCRLLLEKKKNNSKRKGHDRRCTRTKDSLPPRPTRDGRSAASGCAPSRGRTKRTWCLRRHVTLS